MIKFVPPDIAAATADCDSCKSQFPVPLRKSFPHSLAPVIPIDFDEKTNNKFWQLNSLEIDCPICSAKTLLKLPTHSERGKVLLYGDDAARESDASSVFCFSLVGGNMPFVKVISQELREIKRRHEPKFEPDSWSLHMKDLHSGHNRKKHPVYSTWTQKNAESFVSNIFELIAENSKDLFTFSISFASNAHSSLDELKKDSYLALAADVIYGFSKKGFTPVLHFDSEKEYKGLGPVIHGRARDAFQGSQRKLIYSFVSHGLPVPEPIFIKPASHPCLEIADFVSFVIARGHHCKMNNKECEYSSKQIGKVFYSWLRKDGHYGRDHRIGFPWEEVYN